MLNINNPSEMELAKAWTQNMISLLNEGGMWGVPRSESCYRFWKTSKEYEIIQGDGEDCINRVLAELGYKEKEREVSSEG